MAETLTLKLEIVTPEAKIFSDDVEMVTLPGIEGDMGVYPMHMPVMTELNSGELVILKNGEESYFAIGEGFAEITATRVAIMTDMAVNSDSIDELQAEEARRKAEARLNERLSDEEVASVQAMLTRSMTLLQVKHHRKQRH